MKKINTYENKENTSQIRLDSNESFMNISIDKQEAIKKAIVNMDFNRYPDNNYTNLRKLYANYLDENLDEDNIIAGNGSDEMLNLIIGVAIENGKKLYTLSPDFSMYDFYTSLYGGEVIKYETEEDGKIDVDGFIKKGKEEKVDLIIFSNPNNPTGHVLSKVDIVKILESFKDIKVVVDEAYCDFYGKSMISYINKYSNLIVTRTLSKAFGLAALRVGFLISNKENIKSLLKYKVPYNLNSLSQVISEIVLKDKDSIKKSIELIKMKREDLYVRLKKIEKSSKGKIKFYKSKANFIFGRSSEKEKMLKELNLNNISIRNYKDNSFRITVGNDIENEKVVQIIAKVFLKKEL